MNVSVAVVIDYLTLDKILHISPSRSTPCLSNGSNKENENASYHVGLIILKKLGAKEINKGNKMELSDRMQRSSNLSCFSKGIEIIEVNEIEKRYLNVRNLLIERGYNHWFDLIQSEFIPIRSGWVEEIGKLVQDNHPHCRKFHKLVPAVKCDNDGVFQNTPFDSNSLMCLDGSSVPDVVSLASYFSVSDCITNEFPLQTNSKIFFILNERRFDIALRNLGFSSLERLSRESLSDLIHSKNLSKIFDIQREICLHWISNEYVQATVSPNKQMRKRSLIVNSNILQKRRACYATLCDIHRNVIERSTLLQGFCSNQDVKETRQNPEKSEAKEKYINILSFADFESNFRVQSLINSINATTKVNIVPLQVNRQQCSTYQLRNQLFYEFAMKAEYHDSNLVLCDSINDCELLAGFDGRIMMVIPHSMSLISFINKGNFKVSKSYLDVFSPSNFIPHMLINKSNKIFVRSKLQREMLHYLISNATAHFFSTKPLSIIRQNILTWPFLPQRRKVVSQHGKSKTVFIGPFPNFGSDIMSLADALLSQRSELRFLKTNRLFKDLLHLIEVGFAKDFFVFSSEAVLEDSSYLILFIPGLDCYWEEEFFRLYQSNVPIILPKTTFLNEIVCNIAKEESGVFDDNDSGVIREATRRLFGISLNDGDIPNQMLHAQSSSPNCTEAVSFWTKSFDLNTFSGISTVSDWDTTYDLVEEILNFGGKHSFLAMRMKKTKQNYEEEVKKIWMHNVYDAPKRYQRISTLFDMTVKERYPNFALENDNVVCDINKPVLETREVNVSQFFDKDLYFLHCHFGLLLFIIIVPCVLIFWKLKGKNKRHVQ